MYRDIAEDLANAIHDGLFETKLPTESQLMERYNVSRNTIRKAIDLVYQQGLLKRVQGSGYYINKIHLTHKTVVNLSLSASSGTRRSDRKPLTSKVVTFDTVRADEALAKRVGSTIGDEMYRVIRLRYLNDQLYSLENSYYLRSAVRYLSVEAVNNSIFQYLERVYDIRIANSEDYISQSKLSTEEATLMGLPVKTACLTLDETNYYGNNQLFNFSHTIFAYPELAFYFHSANLANN